MAKLQSPSVPHFLLSDDRMFMGVSVNQRPALHQGEKVSLNMSSSLSLLLLSLVCDSPGLLLPISPTGLVGDVVVGSWQQYFGAGVCC